MTDAEIVGAAFFRVVDQGDKKEIVFYIPDHLFAALNKVAPHSVRYHANISFVKASGAYLMNAEYGVDTKKIIEEASA